MQKRIVETARRMGRPVVVATQMLESMIQSPSPTRDVQSFEEMVAKTKRMALRQNLAKAGDLIVIVAGGPFGRRARLTWFMSSG